MIGGSSGVQRGPELPVQIWDSTTDQLQPTEDHRAKGVSGSGADGTPLFLTVPATERSIANLWDVSNVTGCCERSSLRLRGNREIRAWAMTPDGSMVAASAIGLDAKGEPVDTGTIAVWEAATGREIFRTTVQQATDIALAPDASLLAAGHEDGQITVWSVAQGRTHRDA